MTKRGGKLTRAEKIQLSEDQRLAAGIDLSKPSHYAQKIASNNGVDDERLGKSWIAAAPSEHREGHTIGQSPKSLKPRFNEGDLRPARTPHQRPPTPEEFAARRMKHFDLDDDGRFTAKDTGRRFLDPDGYMDYPEVRSLTTMAYKGVADFDQLMRGHIVLPPCAKADANSATFFTAASHSRSFAGHTPVSNWVVERHIIINPDDPDPEIVRDIVYDDTDISPIQIFRGLRNWSNGAENVTQSLPVDHGQSPQSALVLSRDAFRHVTSGGAIATLWQFKTLTEQKSLPHPVQEAQSLHFDQHS